MATVTRLLTLVDIRDQDASAGFTVADGSVLEDVEPGWRPVTWAPAPPESRAANSAVMSSDVMSLSALHMAVLDDGRYLTVLDDRGWTESGPSDIWRHTSVEEIMATARTVVGPDEPFGVHSRQDMVCNHWEHVAGVLGRQGIRVDVRELSRLPHVVELSERLRIRVARVADA